MAETTPVDHLIDISSYNPVSSWRKVADDGITGASIKVSQQVNYLNPLCGAQVAGARSVGIAPGGYHFGDPRVSAAAQAQFFVRNAKPFHLFGGDALAPMYDAENWEGGGLVWPNPKTLNAHIAEHIRVVREETGVRRHLVYASLSWWGTWVDPDLWADDDVLLWIAVYNGQPGKLQGWSHPNDALHQHTSDGIVPGIPGRVDKNVTIRGRRTGDLLISGDDMSAAEVWKSMVPLFPDVDDPDQRVEAEAGEVAGRTNQGTWQSVEYGRAANLKLDALIGRDPVDEVELAAELLRQGLTGGLSRIPDDQFAALVRAIGEDGDRRDRLRASADMAQLEANEHGQ
jgi:GH25 family lysozyme M1 (1,4-beta-N-acetylmuramidase)